MDSKKNYIKIVNYVNKNIFLNIFKNNYFKYKIYILFRRLLFLS